MKNPVAGAVLAIALFFLLAFLVGFTMAHFFAGNDSPTAISYQDADAHAIQLPPAWEFDPSARGQIRDIMPCGEGLFATGPGIGVYTLGENRIWRPFNTGLGDDLDITAVTCSSLGIIIGSKRGRVYKSTGGPWKLIDASGGNTPIAWVRSEKNEIFYTDRDNLIQIGGKNERRRIDLKEFTEGKIAFLHKKSVPSHGYIKNSMILWRNPSGEIFAQWQSPDADGKAYLFAKKPESFALLRASVSDTGLYINGKPALPEEMMKHAVRDAAILPISDANPAPGILAAVDGYGVTRLTIVENDTCKVLGAHRQGLPMETVSSLAAYRGVVYVGTLGKGIYTGPLPEPSRFEPANSGLMYIPK